MFRPVNLLSQLRPGLRPAELEAAVTTPAGLPGAPVGAQTGISSPWSSSQLSAIVWADLLLGEVLPVTRAEAMAVPAVARARHIICGTGARDELRAYRGEGEDAVRLDGREGRPAEPSWISGAGGSLSPFHRMLWTFDDLFFHGWSAWSRTNGADGYPVQLDRIDIGRWGFDGDGHVLVDGVVANQGSVVLIPGPHEGLLNFAQGAVRHAADLQRAAGKAARHPSAYLVLKQTGGTPLTKEQKNELRQDWAEAREGLHGGVGYVNQSIDLQELGSFSEHLVVEGRNAAAVDIARSASLPADIIDADPGVSFTYTNSQDNDRRLIDYGVGLYMAAVSAALSLTGRPGAPGVTPRGQRVVFALEEWLNNTVPGQDPVNVTSSAAGRRGAPAPTPGAAQ